MNQTNQLWHELHITNVDLKQKFKNQKKKTKYNELGIPRSTAHAVIKTASQQRW